MSRLTLSVILLMFVTTATPAEAQGVASTFEQLRLLVRAGDTVTVDESTGTVITGRIESLSPSTLILMTEGRRRELLESDITIIRQRRQDSMANGAIIGLMSGAAAAGVLIAVACADDDCGGGEAAALIAIYAAVGTGIGVGVDALITKKQVIYEKAVKSAQFRVSPLLAPGRRGVALSVAW
jgi:hypothetical protein